MLIMDEVDGMTTGDKGGAVELATLIKKTKIPIICICNDIRSQKVQPLTRVCYDARFKRFFLDLIQDKEFSNTKIVAQNTCQPAAVSYHDNCFSVTQHGLLHENRSRQLITFFATGKS